MIKKIRLLALYELLQSKTDETYPMTTNEIMECLAEQGIEAQRQTIYKDYNQYAFEIIDLQPYYKEQLCQIKQTYREKYFIYLHEKSGGIKTKLDFEEVKQNYDEATLVAPNSVDVQLEKIFENNFGVSIFDLNGIG